MRADISWDREGFIINGEKDYMVSGEFHYFRVPRSDWARRMRLFKEAGGNTIATYVPWLIHEPEEGHILFGDRDERDLAGFLETAKQEEVMVILRPGPYQYSELVHAGLPTWLVRNYPDLMGKTQDGENIGSFSVSYQHPLFLEKARKYYKSFADVVRPYMASEGGPVAMIQLDNELSGIHVWMGSLDYNPVTMGFGKSEGRWPMWLRKKYQTIEELNRIYGSAYTGFAEVMPVKAARDPAEEILVRDYGDFYIDAMAEYLEILASWLREDRLEGPICHNSANPNMNSMFTESVERLGKDFLLGSDHYYNLNPTWPQNHPTPQYALRSLYSLDMLRALEMPPAVLEMPAGNIADTPPILPGDLYATYMVNTAFGMKGVNYYIYTGGPNFPGTGSTCEIYDYNAPISATGEVRDTYYAMQKFGRFVHENRWMTHTHRSTAVQVGFSWKDSRFAEYQPTGKFTGKDAWNFASFDLLYALTCSACPPEMVPVTGELRKDKPLVLSCPERMSREEQQRVVDFIREGGSVLLIPILPDMDENGQKETLLADFLGLRNIRKVENPSEHVQIDGMEDVYMVKNLHTATLPEGAKPIAWDGETQSVVGGEWAAGKGRVIWLGFTFGYNLFTHAKLMENMAVRLGARKVLESENRNVLTAYWTDGEHKLAYAANLFTCPMKTTLWLYDKDEKKKIGSFELSPMEVRVLTDL